MFRQWILVLLGVAVLYGAEPENEAMSPMEMLLFKIGFTALVEEFEQEKNTTRTNSERIAALEKNFELLVKFMEMTKGELMKDRDIEAKPGTRYGIYDTEAMKKELSSILAAYKGEIDRSREAELKRLRSEVAELKRDIRRLAERAPAAAVSEPAAIKEKVHKGAADKQTIRYRVVVDEMNIRQKRSAASLSVGKLQRDDVVTFEACDRFGWCTLSGREGFVPKHLFLPAD